VFTDSFIEVNRRCGDILDGMIDESADLRLNLCVIHFFTCSPIYTYISCDLCSTYSSNIRSMIDLCLLKVDYVVKERPQYLFMRVAVALHGFDLSRVKETYSLLSRGLYIHDIATLRHAGTINGLLCTSYIETLDLRRVDGTYQALARCVQVTQDAAHVGLNVTQFPASR